MRSLFSVFSSAPKIFAWPQGLIAKEAINHHFTPEPISAPSVVEGHDWVVSSHPLRNAFIQTYNAFEHLSELHSHIENLGGEASRIAILGAEKILASSAVTLFLGRALTQTGNRVLSIDFKGQAPKDHEAKFLGLSDLIAGDVSIPDVIQGDKKSDLNMIYAGQKRMTLESHFAHKRLNDVFEPLMLSYERVLMDFGNQHNRFLFEKIAQKSTLVLVVGKGDERHQALMEVFATHNMARPVAVMQDARI